MITHSHSGLFVDIEGIDGSGQSTQVTEVAKRLKKNGSKVGITRAATTGSPIGDLIRQALNHELKISIQALEFLFAADHDTRQKEEIEPILKKGGIVIADRSVWSFVAFGALAMNRDWLFELTCHLIFPDLTFFLKVRPSVAVKRIAAYRPTRDLFEKEKTLAKVWKNYLWLSKKFSDRIVVIDGERPIGKVTEEIMEIVKKYPRFSKLATSY